MSEIDTNNLDPFVLRVEPDKVIGHAAGEMVADVLNTIMETFGPAATERFAIGAIGSIIGCLPVAVGDRQAVVIIEAGLAVLRARIEAGETFGDQGAIQ